MDKSEGDTAEHVRLNVDRRAWLQWGPYVAERAWGTVREDYSHDGEVWSHFPFDHARSRAFRWNEDGLAAICDEDQRLCFGFAFWNGRDPFLKERLFGLDGSEGNHGEDAKECWWHLDATPTASYLKWAYAYPQQEFPYDELRQVNEDRNRLQPEYELEDTSAFDQDRYWDIVVEYAKKSPTEICVAVKVTNAGPDIETIHILPHLWHRNTWSYDPVAAAKVITEDDGALVTTDGRSHQMRLTGVEDGSEKPTPLFCDNETNVELIWDDVGTSPFPKDGINDHVVEGAATVNPQQTGSKAALWYQRKIAPGEHLTLRFVLSSNERPMNAHEVDDVLRSRRTDADDFYQNVIPSKTSDDDRAIARQALAGLVWGKQYYAYDVERWVDGDDPNPPPPPGRGEIRNGEWWHHDAADIISMPDSWEYPWYAAWDLAFHCIPIAHIDPQFAKDQLALMCGPRYMHPNGQLPAYEWSLGDVNPPVHAMAALEVYEIDGRQDLEFLAHIFHKLLLNFTWWVNRKDANGHNVFEGGFLGLDNIGPLDRSEGLPHGYTLEQSDATAWMAGYALHMLEIALELTSQSTIYEDMAIKFFDHFAYVATAMHDRGLWDDTDGFYYDMMRGKGRDIPLKVRSMVGLLPLSACGLLETRRLLEPSAFADHVLDFVTSRQRYAQHIMASKLDIESSSILLSLANVDRMKRVLSVMLDTDEFLSPFGIRSLSAAHRESPFDLYVANTHFSVGYEPGESQTPLFGGNSNWRGPIWFPVNYMMVTALGRYARYGGSDLVVDFPVGSGRQVRLEDVAGEVADRLVALFRPNDSGVRPYMAGSNNRWPERLLFHEYFDGDTGRGLGASHQTGWTSLVADLIIRGVATTSRT